MRPRANILYFPGTNCHAETLRAFQRAGADPRLVFLGDIMAGVERLDSAEIVCLPGGFSFGDHLGAGSIAAVALQTALNEQVRLCQERLMLCICNGFQIAIRAGCFGTGLALGVNNSGTFCDRPSQVHIVDLHNESPWLSGLQGLELVFPCAHGEGRLLFSTAGSWRPALRYPPGTNPDGSADDIAGITSANGRIFGLMDHPERAVYSPDNLAIFANGVRAAGS